MCPSLSSLPAPPRAARWCSVTTRCGCSFQKAAACARARCSCRKEGQRTEFYSLRLAPHHSESWPPHATGSREILHVAEGRIEVAVGREPPHFADAGDTIIFPADLPHSYRNLTGLPAALYLVMVYPERPFTADADIETHAMRH